MNASTSSAFRTGTIFVYEIPSKEQNPLSDVSGYDTYGYSATCDSLAQDFSPLKRIVIV